MTLELSESLVRLLNTNLQMSGDLNWLTGKEPVRDLDARGVVALVVLAEARGAREEETLAAIPPMWRADIRPVCEQRAVIEEKST